MKELWNLLLSAQKSNNGIVNYILNKYSAWRIYYWEEKRIEIKIGTPERKIGVNEKNNGNIVEREGKGQV